MLTTSERVDPKTFGVEELEQRCGTEQLDAAGARELAGI
jgi:hypothetical protein